jgi:hypothetical protein
MKDIILKKFVEKTNIGTLIDTYMLQIRSGAIIDTTSTDPEWKYFVKFSTNNILNVNVNIQERTTLKINILVAPIIANIREETLLRLLAFFSNSHHVPEDSSIFDIEHFKINALKISISYYPLIIKNIDPSANIFSLKNYNLILSPQIIQHVDGIQKLIEILKDRWIIEINPENILQFVPNVKIIQPYAVPVMNFFQVIMRYFKNSYNKKRIRDLTKDIAQGTGIVAGLVKRGVQHIWDFFA